MDFTHPRSHHRYRTQNQSVIPGLVIRTRVPLHRRHRFPVANLLLGLLTFAVAAGTLSWWYVSRRPAVSAGTAVPGPKRVSRPVVRQTAPEKAGPTWAESHDFTTFEREEEAFPASDNPYSGPLPPRIDTTVDKIVFSKLAELNIQPAPVCTDAVFLRRVYLTTLGTIPTVEEARHFLDDPAPDKRARLIDELLQRPEFADYAAMKWCDILRVKAEFPINLWPGAAQAYHHWVRTAMEQNMPCDRFAYELLTASGSNFRTPQVNFYRAVQAKDARTLAQAAALTFLCQRADSWPEERLAGMSQFFSQVGYKPTGEWKEEIVYFDRRKGLEAGRRGPVEATFPDGEKVTIPPGTDPREVFAKWLTSPENAAFSRAIANRIWYWTYGRGIVEEPDDMRADNPPIHPELLDLLARELVDSGFDLRQLYRLILNSQTYQLSCVPNSANPRAGRCFAYFPIRRLEAEVLIDVICQITGTTEVYSSIIPEPFTFLPEDQRAVALPDGSITSSFLEMFGRPARDTGLESERNNQLTAAQALHLLNSNHIRGKLKQGPGVRDLMMSANSIEGLYLGILSRRPTEQENGMSFNMDSFGPTRDLSWVLINSDEFLFQH